jgi:hypothetical protein
MSTMNRLSSAVLRLRAFVAAGTTAIIATLGPATSAAAASDHSLSIRGTAVCDAEAREWVITWTLTNLSEAAGTFGNVRAYPAGRPLVGLPGRVQPGETVIGTQRTLASEYTAYLVLDVNWDDGPVTYDHNWPTYIHMFCAAV